MEPVAWLLLTTMPSSTTTDALERLAWYATRWGIEIWRKGLQSGGRIEDRQLETATRLNRWVARSSVMAWRILYATMLARVVPDTPCTALLDDEWQALYCRIQRVATPPATLPKLRTAVRWIANSDPRFFAAGLWRWMSERGPSWVPLGAALQYLQHRMGVVSSHHQVVARQPASQLHNHVAPPIGAFLVTFAAFLIITFRRGQAGKKAKPTRAALTESGSAAASRSSVSHSF